MSDKISPGGSGCLAAALKLWLASSEAPQRGPVVLLTLVSRRDAPVSCAVRACLADADKCEQGTGGAVIKKMAGKLGAEISGRRTGRDEMVCGWPATGDGRGCARVSSRRTADGTRVRPKRGLSPISRWTGGLGHREGWPFICALRGAPGVKGKATPTDQVLCTVRARDTQSGKRACASVRLAAVVSGSSDH